MKSWKLNFFFIFFIFDRASRYICVIKTNLMHYLSSVYFVSQPLHVSGIFVAHHQEVYYIHTLYIHLNPANRQSTKKHNTYQLLYIYSVPPDDGLQICPKLLEVDWRNKQRISSASSGFNYIELKNCLFMEAYITLLIQYLTNSAKNSGTLAYVANCIFCRIFPTVKSTFYYTRFIDKYAGSIIHILV